MASQQTSNTLASDIIIRARYPLKEPTANVWSDVELLSYLNEGTLDIVSRSHCLEGKETEALIENTLSYALTESYITIRTVVYTQGSGVEKGLLRGNLQSIGHAIQAKEPKFWTSEQDNVIIYPKPDANHSGTGHNIDVYTVATPAVVAASEAVKVPAYYDKALILYIVTRAFEKDDQFSKSGYYMAEYQTEIDRFRADFTTIPKEPEGIVK